jgi:hypothetical protein
MIFNLTDKVQNLFILEYCTLFKSQAGDGDRRNEVITLIAEFLEWQHRKCLCGKAEDRLVWQ